MLLSVIIVNYNVRYFLEQCLCSVEKALRTAGLRNGVSGSEGSIEGRDVAEVIVVDNASADGSREYLTPRFSRVRFIFNQENKGFGAANNQALREATGEFVLFLNPDTIIPEEFFSYALSAMRDHPRAGAAGFRMVDGSGRYLKESKRGYPGTWVAFCKMSGLTGLFPGSRIFAGYYLGQLAEDRETPVRVLSGACMLVRKEALDRTGGFDERFFMYAEDIDLSYRIEQAGFTNYYFPGSTMIHFKGESTHKDARYIRLFYNAMSQFRRKHSGRGPGRLVNAALDAAIWARAGLSAMGRVFRGGGYRSRGSVKSGRPGWASQRVLLAEGDDLSFRQIIDTIEKNGQTVPYVIHAEGSSSYAGSPSKDGLGISGPV